MIGRAWLDLGKLEEAIEALGKAVDLDPKDAIARFTYGKALEQKDDNDRAEECYRRAIELDPSYPFPYLYLAEMLDEVRTSRRSAAVLQEVPRDRRRRSVERREDPHRADREGPREEVARG